MLFRASVVELNGDIFQMGIFWDMVKYPNFGIISSYIISRDKGI